MGNLLSAPVNSANNTTQAKRVFTATLVATLALKVAIAAFFPITDDEAFFYQWGVRPDWGYSDHPPMVGWMLYALRQISDHVLVLRSLTVLLTSFIAWGMVRAMQQWLPREQEAVAWWAGAIYLVMPWSWMFVLVTTDTPLIFFMVLSVYCYLQADRASQPTGWYAAAGLLVGLAFLSKYFAALLGIAYAVHLLATRRERWWAVALMFACALPAIGLNVYYNATHGWTNIMFNIYNRNEGSHWQIGTFAVFLGMLIYLFNPWLVWSARKNQHPVSDQKSSAWLYLWAVPVAVFAALAFRRTIGLHWVLGFVPVFMVWASCRVDAVRLSKIWRWTLVLSIPHLLGVAAIAWAPIAWWESSKLYEKVVFLRESSAVAQQLAVDLPAQATLATYAYSPAAILMYHHQHYVPVFGVGRHHARQDDQVVDFRLMDQKPMRIFLQNQDQAEPFKPYFESVKVKHFQLSGVTFYYLDGTHFNYKAYRDQVLAQMVKNFYSIPDWLPLLGSPFCERYGFETCSPNRAPEQP
ncbi:MAG: hypothetical protein RL323_1289 [Pseudomonadota bacterium]